MEKDKKVIYPMMIELNETIKDTVYYVSLPKIVKDKWIELECKSKSTYNPMYNLPTYTLKNMLSTYLDGVINMNPVSNSTDDSKWLVSFKEVNIKIVLNCFKIWVDEFYNKGAIAKDSKRKNDRDDNVKKLATELIALLSMGTFGELQSEEVVLFKDGHAVDKESYQLYPLRIVNYLMGKTIVLKGIETKLLYSSRNELITDTHDFHSGDDYYSFLIRLTVQTLPPENKTYLNIDLSVRRWICRNEKKDGSNFLPNDKNCYIRVKSDRMQSIKTEYSIDEKKNVWKRIDTRCFKECQLENDVPNFVEVLKMPAEYNHGKVGDVLIPFEEGIEGISTSIKSGVSFIDRKTVFEFVQKHVYSLDNISSTVEAVNVRKKVKNTKIDFYENDDPRFINSDNFLKQLDNALNGEALTIEIYADEEIRNALTDKLGQYLNKSTRHKIRYCDIAGITDKLEKTPLSKADNLPGFEIRVNEITKRLKNVNSPTLAFIAIHGKEYFYWLDRKIDVDPKKAIRSGFAETGRLTQFITYEQFDKQEDKVAQADEKYEKKKARAEENGNKMPAQSRTDELNMAIEGAIKDGFRELGVVFDYEINKHMKGKKIVGIHVCNYKRTMYGSIPLFPIIITYDVDRSKVMAYCELVDKVDLPYWKVILGLSKLSLLKDTSDLRKNLSSTTTYRRLDRIINKGDSDVVLIIDANGTSRQIVKGIANSEIQKIEKTEFLQTKKLLIFDERYIDLTECPNELSVIRLRHNDEIPSYFTMDKDIENDEFMQQSGIFKYKNIYYSIDGRAPHERKAFDKNVSKAVDKTSLSHRNMIEIYPIFVTGDERNHAVNEEIAVGIVDMLRSASIQFTSQKTILPLPLHMAVKMEEYI